MILQAFFKNTYAKNLFLIIGRGRDRLYCETHGDLKLATSPTSSVPQSAHVCSEGWLWECTASPSLKIAVFHFLVVTVYMHMTEGHTHAPAHMKVRGQWRAGSLLPPLCGSSGFRR